MELGHGETRQVQKPRRRAAGHGRDGHDGRVPPRAQQKGRRVAHGLGRARGERHAVDRRLVEALAEHLEELAAEHQDVRAAVAAPLGRCPGAVVQDLQAGRRRARGHGTERGISVRPEADALTRLARRRHISTKPQHGRRELRPARFV